MMKKGDQNDPKGLIYEAFRIEGIGKPECRSIFLDWALSLPTDTETHKTLAELLARYGVDHADHPMTEVLREGQISMATPRRRGGWRGRTRS